MPGISRQSTLTSILGNNDTRVSYNDYIFPSSITSRLISRSVATDSGRTVKRIDYTLSLEFVLCIDDFVAGNVNQYGTNNSAVIGAGAILTSAGLTMDAVYQELTRRLLEKGKSLNINGLGCGQISILPGYSNGLQTDINNGPTPTQLDITRFDAARSLHVVWSVNFSLSPCQNSQLIEGVKVSEFDFSIHYTVDNSGMMVRNVYGSVELPNFNDRGRTKFNPENTIQGKTQTIKEMIVKTFPIPAGFERRMDFTTNPSRTKIQFSVTDTEIPSDNPYFPGTVRIDVSHTVNNLNAIAPTSTNQAVNYGINLSGSIEVAPGRNKFWGWNALVSILRNRLTTTDITYYQAFFTITDHIYQRRINFSIDYKSTFNPSEFFQNTQLFSGVRFDFSNITPTPGSPSGSGVPNYLTWDKHNQDRQYYLGPFGYDGKLIFKPGEENDKVVNLCDQSPPETPTGSNNKDIDEQSKKDRQSIPQLPLGTNVTEASSYSHYRNTARITSNFNVVVHGIIGQSDSGVTKDAVNNAATDLPATYVHKGIVESNRPKTTANVQQVRGTGSHYLILEGEASRVKYGIAIPKVQSIEGIEGEPQFLFEEINPSQQIGWTADCIPIYGATWKRVYCLPQLGAKVQIAAVPIQYVGRDVAYTLPTKTSGNPLDVINRRKG